MAEINAPSIKEKLWHKMRGDLVEYVPEVAGSRLLMCCCCGRFLAQEDFDLEHLIPQRVLKHDPPAVKSDPAKPANARSGNLLLCKKPLKPRGPASHANGCNSWKGRFYDAAVEELLTGIAFDRNKARQGNYIGAALCLCYLAMVAEFGYRVVLMPSGVLMRRQFFHPQNLLQEIPSRCQMLLTGSTNALPSDVPMWARPFTFGFVDGACSVSARTFSVLVPVSQDPRLPVAKHLRIVPARYKLRPDFSSAFQ